MSYIFSCEYVAHLRNLNPGSTSEYDNEHRISVLKVPVKKLEDVEIPDDLYLFGNIIIDPDEDRRICRIELIG